MRLKQIVDKEPARELLEKAILDRSLSCVKYLHKFIALKDTDLDIITSDAIHAYLLEHINPVVYKMGRTFTQIYKWDYYMPCTEIEIVGGPSIVLNSEEGYHFLKSKNVLYYPTIVLHDMDVLFAKMYRPELLDHEIKNDLMREGGHKKISAFLADKCEYIPDVNIKNNYLYELLSHKLAL